MAIHVTVPMSAINTEIELPITIGVGEVVSTVGTLTLEVREGKVEDVRPALAEALREAAAAVERATTDDEEEVEGAAP
ncbi:hypothetical protein ACF07F_16490 [Streptomyces sp. NPDC015237]|uniref:hypothetical protein n=1 Tax=Streptomyces sp. NPDC015237 TaxID=3364949 RepID=UPI003703237A